MFRFKKCNMLFYSGYEIRYLSLLTNSICNKWTCQWCSYDELFQSFFAYSDLFMTLWSESLLVVQRCLWHLEKGQLKPEGKNRVGWLGGVGKKTCHPDITQNLSKEQIQWFLSSSCPHLLNEVKAGKTLPGD